MTIAYYLISDYKLNDVNGIDAVGLYSKPDVYQKEINNKYILSNAAKSILYKDRMFYGK